MAMLVTMVYGQHGDGGGDIIALNVVISVLND